MPEKIKDLPSQLTIGTCSWKYDSWKGLVYSDAVGDNYLKEYAEHYKMVEIDQWFWSLFGENIAMPKPDVITGYLAAVPDDFRFSIKVPNSITLTHQYIKKKGALIHNPHFLSNRLFSDFLQLLEPIVPQIDSLIFQFEYLNKNKMPGQNAFHARLSDFFQQCPIGYRYCIETRNQNYLNQLYFDFLNSQGLYHVFLQGYWMPPIFDVYERFGNQIKDFSVIRLLGPDRKDIEQKTKKKWNTIVNPRDGELHQLKGMIRDLLAKEVQVSLNVNNHYEGSAPITIQRFMDLYLRNVFN